LCKHLIVGTAADPAPVRELADYTGPLRRRWRWVALGTALGLLLGLAAAGLVHHDYTSTASVVVTPTTVQQQGNNNANGRTQDVINLDTEAQIVKSDAVAARVRRVLHASASLATIEHRVSVTVPPNTTVLRISYSAGSPRGAAAGAQAYATSYLAFRAFSARHLLQSQEAAVRNQIASVADQLTLRNAQTPGAAAGQHSLNAVRYRALVSESTALAKQLSTLATTVVTPGSVIAGATTPSGGSGRWLLFLLSGALIGLLLGAGAAVVYDRTDTRLRDPRDLEDAGLDVVGAVDTPSSAIRTYTRAGNAILGTPPGRGGVVLVVGPVWETRDDDVGLNVATAIHDLAGSVALVRIEDGTAETTLLGAPGEVPREDSAVESPKLSASFGAATRRDLRQIVERLKEDADFVVVDAADPLAEAVLPACDTALFVVSMNETRVSDVVDAAREMEQEGVRVLGAVVVPGRGRAAFGRWPLDSISRRLGDASRGSDALPAPERTSSRA
jgi:capsular polysaccharide biosynthesis protein